MLVNGDGIPKDLVQAAKWFQKAAEKGYPMPRVSWLRCMKPVRGSLKIPPKRRNGTRRSLNRETWRRCIGWGSFMKWHGGGKDLTTAASWFHKAADQGNLDAQIKMGVMYYLGEGVAKDPAQTALWYRKAADQGSADAQYRLG